MRGTGHALGLAAVLLGAACLAACNRSTSGQAPAVVRAEGIANTPVGPWPGTEVVSERQANPFTGDEDAIAQGRRFFVQYNCAGCHGDHGGGGMGPSLRDQTWLYGDSDAQIARSIVDGRAQGMPAWGQMLTSAQVWQIAAYIKSMRTEDEAEPPRE